MKPENQSFCLLAKVPVFSLWLAVLALIAPGKAAASTFTAMTTPLPSGFSPGHMLLLSDGRVLVQQTGNFSSIYSNTLPGGNVWNILTPDGQGHYFDGTWSTNCASMHDTREYGATAVLTNGWVLIAGGEYGTGAATAELFDPQANGGAGSWTYINPPTFLLDPATDAFIDSESVILPTGNVLVAPVNPSIYGGTLIYSPSANSWSAGGTNDSFSSDEASWVKLPDDSILTVDPYGQNCQRYLPALNIWIEDQPTPTNMWSGNGGEIGASLLQTNGTVLYFSGENESEIYTQSPLGGTNFGSWAPGPNIPNNLVMRDAPAAMLANGKILLDFETATNDKPSYIYEYDEDTQAFTLIHTNNHQISDESSMLDLPDGTVLYNDTGTVFVYQPDPSPITAGKPTIQSVSWKADGSLHLTGTLFNGISQGAMYGDEFQQDSNYPLVRFTSGSSVYYGFSYNWGSTSVQTGSRIMTTEVAVPLAVLNFPGQWSLQVVANGNASDGVTFYSPVWVDFNLDSEFQAGWYAFPYYTLPQGVFAITNSYPGGTIAIRGDVQPSIGHETVPYTISSPMTIISVSGPSTIGN
jgi:hypothetical protein